MTTQQVHLRVNDAETGKPTPVRLRVADAAGNYYAPLGRLTHFAAGPNQDVGGNVGLGGKSWAYIDGACEINLPPGPLHISIAKGPEYRPVETDVQLIAGKLSLRSQIERWADLRRDGWYSGDTRVHYLTPHAALLEVQAEDVAVVQLLARATQIKDSFDQSQPAIPNLLAFSGQAPCLQAPGHLVTVNTENYHPELGSLGLLHCHRVVYPLTFGGPSGEDDWTLEDWCGQCHRKNGLVVWTRTLHETEDFNYGEPLVDLLLGQVDAFELTGGTPAAMSLWYDLLNVGVRVPLAGASGKDSNAQVMGATRSYVKLAQDEALSSSAWIEGLRAGRSFVTIGPLLDFRVNGHGPGSRLQIEPKRVRVRAEATSWRMFERLEIICGGRVVATASATGQPARSVVEVDVPLEHSTWLAARSSGDEFAHTSPVYVEVLDRPIATDRAAATRLQGEIEQMIGWCRRKARCSTPQVRERLMAGFVKAGQILMSKFERARSRVKTRLPF
jgi:hypothetical protein